MRFYIFAAKYIKLYAIITVLDTPSPEFDHSSRKISICTESNL